MKIQINTETYQVPAEEELLLLRQVQQMLEVEYDKLEEVWRLVAKPIARKVLMTMEEDVRKKHGKEKALMLRPGKGDDPCIHLSLVLLAVLQEAMKHVTFQVEHDCCTVSRLDVSIENKGQDGGQVALNGHDGVRQDNRSQVP